MKTLFLFLFFCFSANAQTAPQYLYNFKPVPFELDCSKNAKNGKLPTLTWSFRYHFKIKNADTAHLNIAVTPPFYLKNFIDDEFEIVAELPFEDELKMRLKTPSERDSLFKRYLNDTITRIRIKNGNKTAEFSFKTQAVPDLVLFLSCKKFQAAVIDSCEVVGISGIWERPSCAGYYKSRFYGHFETALYDMKGRKLQYYGGWYDGGDRTRDYDLSAKKYGLQKGELVELRIDTHITSLFRDFPDWSKTALHTKLKISPTQPLIQRFRLQ